MAVWRDAEGRWCNSSGPLSARLQDEAEEFWMGFMNSVDVTDPRFSGFYRGDPGDENSEETITAEEFERMWGE